MKRLALALGCLTAIAAGCSSSSEPATSSTSSRSEAADAASSRSEPSDGGFNDADLGGFTIIDPGADAAPDGYIDAGPLPIDATSLTLLLFTATGSPRGSVLDATVSDASVVRALFDETATQPQIPAGPYVGSSCPAQTGPAPDTAFHLAFSGTAGTLTFDVTGVDGCLPCVSVKGVPRSQISPGYYADLAAALGVPESALLPAED